MAKKKLSLKEIQNIELDILSYLDKVCKENSIKYYMSSGTLLGAVKYKGFIPWDDDIDVVLFRDDYLKLIDIIKEKNDRYKILSIYNVKDYYYPFAKLVDSKTVLIENSKKIDDMGVYIDILSLDSFKDQNIEKDIYNLRIIKNLMIRRFRIKDCIRSNFDYMKFTESKVKYKKIKDFIYGLVDFITLPLGYNFWTKLYDKKVMCTNKDYEYICSRANGFGVKEFFKRKDIIEQDVYEFAGRQFTSFKNYDLYLTSKYGDYKKTPSKEQQISHHQFEAYWRKNEK